VAVPAVLGYNWLIRRNKVVAEQLASFATDLHGYMVSAGAVRPAAIVKAAPAPAIKK
jgi:biopolymer transport protein ExbB